MPWGTHALIKWFSITLDGVFPDSKVHGANMGLTWVLSALDGPHVGPMNLAMRVIARRLTRHYSNEGWPVMYRTTMMNFFEI